MDRRHTTLIKSTALALAIVLAACGGGDDDDAALEPASTVTASDTGAGTSTVAGSDSVASTTPTTPTTPSTEEAPVPPTEGGGENGGENGGDDSLESVQWGPDDPPIPGQYLAWSPSPTGELQCELTGEAPDHPFWDLAAQVCRALTGQGDWPAADAVPAPPEAETPYHTCLDSELAAVLERALAWRADHPGATPTLDLPADGTHSPCQQSLHAVSPTVEEDSVPCGDLPLPLIRIELIVPGDPPEGNDPPASVRDEQSCVPQDSQDIGARQLHVIVAGRSDARRITVDVVSDYGTLSTEVELPAVPGAASSGTTEAPATDPTTITPSTITDDTS